MRYSTTFIPTLKEVPSEAQIPSHQLMIRAGMARSLASGVYSFLPLGYIVVKKVMQILREEMDAIGGQEFHLPALNPIEIWEQTGRVAEMDDVLFHIKNRDGLVLAPTHEEIIAYHARQHIKSYKDLPQIWYQIQTKFRNEPRPRSGVLRGRQFVMKDSYTLDATTDGLDAGYEKHRQAYERIFTRCGLNFFSVGASSGAMGGSGSQEFMVESDHGEDTCALAEDNSYAANIEVATSWMPPIERVPGDDAIEKFDTPAAKTINDLINKHGIPEERCAKSVVYIADGEPLLILMCGNDELNEEKLARALDTTQFRPAEENELVANTGAHGGSIGPVGLKNPKMRIIADLRLKGVNGLVSGANEDGQHYRNIDLERDATIESWHDLRVVQEGERVGGPDGPKLRVVRAIEIGHIFKLGTKYSKALNAVFLDENGREHPIIMGSYGIGVERIVACYIEQNHDELGIRWNAALTPYDVQIVGMNTKKSETVRAACEELEAELQAAGLTVLYDDRPVSPGVKFKDADLLGFPVQLVVGDKNLDNGQVEVKSRKTGERELTARENALEAVLKVLAAS